ncbi:MAG: GatB/YqeY domain-containing protein [Thiotrichaceae bacterium]|nr:GatB/YqeY domain-containing protein [Thiotrichaceae bacterium]
MSDSLKTQLSNGMKDAMRAKDKNRLETIRLMLSAIKQQEVDQRIDLDDTAVLAILDKQLKQRRDSMTQFTEAGRDDLAKQEGYEIDIIQEYLPSPLSDDEINQLITTALKQSGAESMRDMGKVMAIIKPQAQGRADMGKISGMIKSHLS